MRLNKFLLWSGFFTFVALLYVYQQSEIYRLAYTGQKKSVEFQELLDKNTMLRYNIESQASLIRLGDKISSGKDYEMPKKYQLVRVSGKSKQTGLKIVNPKRINVLAQLLSVKRQAEAKTINP